MALHDASVPLLNDAERDAASSDGAPCDRDLESTQPCKDDESAKSPDSGKASRKSISVAVMLVGVIGLATCCGTLVVLVCISQWQSVLSGNSTALRQESGVSAGKAVLGYSTYSKKPWILEAENGMVAADDERCSLIGRDVLRDGGNAIDAAVATTLCLGVVSPESSGLGGGAFMLVRLATGEAIAYDMRETAPAAATEDMYADDLNSKSVGSLSIGVPGELAGLHLAWRNHGKLPWTRLVRPSVRLAYHGFEVSPYLANKIKSKEDVIFAYPALAQFLAPKGILLQAGDICFRKQLGKTLALIGRFGARVFYKGKIAENLVKDVRAAGGILTLQDLANYQTKVRRVVSAEVMGHTVLGMPPPSSGGAALIMILNILACYKSPTDFMGALGLHRMVEAFKHTYAVRMNIGDPDFVNVTGVVQDMLSPKFASELQEQIVDNTTFPEQYYGGRWSQLTDHGTSHFNIVDRERNAVSLTSTVNDVFGSYIVSPSTGIVLNNEMDDFAVPTDISPDKLPPSEQNFIKPNKRPLSAMAPTIVVKNGQVTAVVGASGGSKIITASVQVLINLLVKAMDPLASVVAARVHHQLVPNVVQYENWTVVTGDHIELSNDNIQALEERGHKLESKASGAIVQLVVQDLHKPVNRWGGKGVIHGKLTGVSDLRKDGAPAGL